MNRTSKKKKPNLYIVITALCALVFILGGCIIYNQNTSNETFVIDDKVIEPAIKTSLINIGKIEKQGGISDSNSIWAEGHKTLRIELKDGRIYAYILARIGSYTKKNGTYENTFGVAGPVVIVFTKNYEFISYEMPSDGESWSESLKRIFPSDLINQSTDVNYGIDFYQDQINTYLN